MTKKKKNTSPRAAKREIVPEPEQEVSDANVSFLDRTYGQRARWFIAIALVFGCVLIYFQVSGFQFINFDDNVYVYNNQPVLGGLSWESLKWAFTSFHASNWHPVTWLSHQLDMTLFGLRPGYHHLTNVFLHALNSVLLFFTIRLMTGATWKSGVVAAIFAFHPAHVESVAWVAERKDVLSTMFWLLTTWFYIRYARGEGKRATNCCLVPVFFTLGLMAKPMLVTLPFVFLLMDYWPLARIIKLDLKTIWSLVGEKLPLFCLAAASSVVTYFVQKTTGAVVALDFLPVSQRIANAIVAYAKYVLMMFYPADLGGWYPYKEQGLPGWQVALAAIVIGAISLAAVLIKDRKRYFFVGWFWFIGTLVPVIGLVQVGRQSHADRYTYIPFIGLSIAIVWLAAAWVEKARLNKDAVTVVVMAILVLFGIMSFRQAGYWRNNEKFFTRTLAVTEKNYLFEQNYCEYLSEQDRLDEAEVQCRNSITNHSNYSNSWLSLGVIEMKRGNYEEARKDFEVASRLRPGDIVTFSNYINALLALDRLDEAAEKISLISSSAIPDAEKNPYLTPLYRVLSLKFAGKGETEKAIDTIKRSLAIDGGQSDLRANLGLLLYKAGKKEEALTELIAALDLNPKQPDLQTAVGRILLEQGKREEAARYFEAALASDPNMKAAQEGLEKTRGQK